MSNLLKLTIALGLALAALGCSNDAPIAEGTVKNASGETEGKEPTFVMVPAQNDPNAPATK